MNKHVLKRSLRVRRHLRAPPILCACSLVPKLGLHRSYRRLQYEYRVIRTASDDSCGGGLGTRLVRVFVASRSEDGECC